MAEQLPLHVDVCRGKHGGNKESKDAHTSIVHAKDYQCEKILEFVSSRGEFGATGDEIACTLGMRMASVSARRSEMLTSGALVKTNRQRKTSSGRLAAVVVAKEHA